MLHSPRKGWPTAGNTPAPLRLRVLQPGTLLPLRGTLGECHALHRKLFAHDCKTLLDPTAQRKSPPLS
jgi:hypothetical protein